MVVCLFVLSIVFDTSGACFMKQVYQISQAYFSYWLILNQINWQYVKLTEINLAYL